MKRARGGEMQRARGWGKTPLDRQVFWLLYAVGFLVRLSRLHPILFPINVCH